MGRIVVHTFATLDGVIDAAPDEAFHPYMDDATMAESLALVTASDAMLLGRETYEGLAQAWTPQSGPLADRLNTMPKYVLSRTLQATDAWANTTIVSYDEVAALRERLNLVSYGCGRIARDLVRDGLLDEFQLWLAPVVAGSGTRLFAQPDALVKLELAEAGAFGGGAVRLTFARTA